MMMPQIYSESLQNKIVLPQFYDTIAEFKGGEIRQGSFFVGNAEYLHEDQFICVVRGSLDVKAVPHIYRDAMYAGQYKLERDLAL